MARGPGVIAFAGAAARAARPRAREREEGQHPVLPRQRGRGSGHQGKNASKHHGPGSAQSQNAVPWLEQEREQFKAKVVAMPKRDDVQTPPINEQLIVELYSK